MAEWIQWQNITRRKKRHIAILRKSLVGGARYLPYAVHLESGIALLTKMAQPMMDGEEGAMSSNDADISNFLCGVSDKVEDDKQPRKDNKDRKAPTLCFMVANARFLTLYAFGL